MSEGLQGLLVPAAASSASFSATKALSSSHAFAIEKIAVSISNKIFEMALKRCMLVRIAKPSYLVSSQRFSGSDKIVYHQKKHAHSINRRFTYRYFRLSVPY